jgi:hypothetical protein
VITRALRRQSRAPQDHIGKAQQHVVCDERLEILGVPDGFLVEDRRFFANQGLLRQDVEASAAKPPISQRTHHRLDVNDVAACRIDQDCTLLHAGELAI